MHYKGTQRGHQEHHIDGREPLPAEKKGADTYRQSRLTCMVYLNTAGVDFEGGSTTFLDDALKHRPGGEHRPVAGDCICFYQENDANRQSLLLHQGSDVTDGDKRMMRTVVDYGFSKADCRRCLGRTLSTCRRRRCLRRSTASADCGADLGPQRLAEEEQRGKRNKIEDHFPLVDFVAASKKNLRVTHATLGKGTLHELRGVSAAIVFDCDPCVRRVVLPCSDVEEFRNHLEMHHAMQSHRRGIRLDALLAFAHDHDCMEWPVKTVVRDIIIPATRETMCRYAELPELQGMFGKATVFMSHCWGGRFGDLVGAACHGARMDRILWIDIFAVRQWPRSAFDLNFRGVIERSEAMVVSTSPVVGLSKNFLEIDDDRAAFLASKKGEAAKKTMPFCRLW